MHQLPFYQLIPYLEERRRHTVSRDLYFLTNRVESATFAPVISLNSAIICVSRCLFAFVDCHSAWYRVLVWRDIPWWRSLMTRIRSIWRGGRELWAIEKRLWEWKWIGIGYQSCRYHPCSGCRRYEREIRSDGSV